MSWVCDTNFNPTLSTPQRLMDWASEVKGLVRTNLTKQARSFIGELQTGDRGHPEASGALGTFEITLMHHSTRGTEHPWAKVPGPSHPCDLTVTETPFVSPTALSTESPPLPYPLLNTGNPGPSPGGCPKGLYSVLCKRSRNKSALYITKT